MFGVYPFYKTDLGPFSPYRVVFMATGFHGSLEN